MSCGAGGAARRPATLCPSRSPCSASKTSARSWIPPARENSPSPFPTSCAVHRDSVSSSPPPIAPPRSFCTICSRSSNASLAAHRALLAEFLKQCDMAKFAGASLSRPDHRIAAPQRPQLRDRDRARAAAPRRGRPMIRFLQPEWLWLLTLLPLVMLLRGRRGPSPPSNSPTWGSPAKSPARTRSRAVRWVWLFPILAAALMIVGLARPQRGAQPHRSHRQRHRHRARTGCVRLHAGARFHDRRPPRQPHPGRQIRGLEIHRGAAQRPHRPHRLRRRTLLGQSAHPRS